MRKIVTVTFVMLIAAATVVGQAVRDRNVIPVSVNLNQVLRMTVTNGGNIEFVFNTIDEYKEGISGDVSTTGLGANDGATEDIYKTDFNVASSTRWLINYGAERDALYGTDVPANSIGLDNVGFSIEENGTHEWGTELRSVLTSDGADIVALAQYPVLLIDDNDNLAAANAGEASDNDFTISWRVGTAEGTMNAAYLIEQSPEPDRYTVNVLFDLATDY